MKPIFFVVLITLSLTACERPTEQQCEDAVKNIFSIHGQKDQSPKAWIRSCRANASTETVQCMTTATTASMLEQCEQTSVTQ